MLGQRTAIRDLQPSPPEHGHPGLWLDKHRRGYGDDVSGRNLVLEVCKIKETSDYAGWFEAWKEQLEALRNTANDVDVHLVTFVPLESSRLAVGLGAESVLENSIAIHRTYGVPFIPGSALKGLASSFAHRKLENNKWRKNGGAAYQVVFGDTNDAGFVTFFDALPLPGSWVLHPQVMTVHHQEYYQDGSAPPADWDSPNPNPFISASGAFLVALAGPSEWVTLATQILERALKREGVGAKTSSGFGRLKLSATPSAYTKQESYADAGHVHVADEPNQNNRDRETHPRNEPPVSSTGPNQPRHGSAGSVQNQPRSGGNQMRTSAQAGVVNNANRQSGTVLFWNADRGFGKIAPDAGGADVFVHFTEIRGHGRRSLKENQKVTYNIGQGKKPGSTQALDVEIKP